MRGKTNSPYCKLTGKPKGAYELVEEKETQILK